MIHRLAWDQLPVSLREAVQARTGNVLTAESPPAGRNSALCVSLRTAQGQVFCKGVQADSPQAFMHHNETAISPYLPRELAPQLLWRIEQDGWLLLGFEHDSGQHADFSPGSPHLALIARTVQAISDTSPPPSDVAQRIMAHQWATAVKTELDTPPPTDADSWDTANLRRLADWAAQAPEHMDGTTLIHSDLNPMNVLVSSTARAVDWAWWRTGATWVDPAFLIIRLIAAGHEPTDAETFATRFPGYRTAPPDAITAFAASVLRLWARKFPSTHATQAARQWARYRLNHRP